MRMFLLLCCPAVKLTHSPLLLQCTYRKIHGHQRDVPVGMLFKSRQDALMAGVHGQLEAGIHGSIEDGAYSIVVNGGYPNDDKGETLYVNEKNSFWCSYRYVHRTGSTQAKVSGFRDAASSRHLCTSGKGQSRKGGAKVYLVRLVHHS